VAAPPASRAKWPAATERGTATVAGAALAPQRPALTEQDLARRVGLALSIARRAVAHLGETGYRDEADLADSFGPDKPLAETAMLLYVCDGMAGAARQTLPVDALCEVLAPLARAPRTALAIAQHPTICFQLAMPHLLLSRLGSVEPGFDRLLALGAESVCHHGREVLPHRALEALWLHALWSGEPSGPAFDQAAAASAMNHPLDLLWGSREDAYAHTHTFMYFTDFGYAARPLPRPREQVIAESSCLLARSLLLEDFDLAAELLMIWPMTGAAWTPAAVFGLRALAELEDRVGYLPAANGVPERLRHLTGSERTRYALAASYHTAYVMGMLCALALRPGRAPPPAIAGAPAPDGLMAELWARIPESATPWQQSFRRLPAPEQGVLAPFLLDMALLATVRAHDLAAAASLLRVAAQHGMANAPACAQTAQLLQRMASCAEAAQAPARPYRLRP